MAAEQRAQFIGTHEHGLDDKGRMVLPAKIRAQLGESGVIAKLDGCLGLWTHEGFLEVANVFEDAVEDADNEDDKEEALDAMRHFVGDAVEITPDQQGRIVINATLREYAGLGSEVVITGLIRRAEIWDKDAWTAKAESGDAGVSRTVRQVGLTGRRAPR
ncbi:MAG: division/cell wall cluster transcriptional repressor MraZ [Acidimicrobiales bacterium]